MKKIENRLIITNVLIVITTLLAFFTLVTLNFNRYYVNDLKQQLIKENTIALRTINTYDNQLSLVPVRLLTDSSTLIYRKARSGYQLVNKGGRDLEIPLEKIDELTTYEEGVVNLIEIDDVRYYFTYSEESFVFNKDRGVEVDVIVVSIISNSDISFFNTSNTRILVASMVVLSLVAALISIIMGKRLTRPIIKLTKISKQYSNRNFEERIEVSSQDEIGELANSMNDMATSLINYQESQNQFYRDLSHEIKTPLTSIYGYAEGINQDIFKDNQKPSKIIMEESLRIKEMLEDIILINKLDSKVEKFEFERRDISDTVIKAIEKIEGVAILKDISIDYKPESVTINYDEEKMLRVLINVLSNSIKYTNDFINVAIQKDKDLVIEITDNGSGFSEEALANFDHEITKGNSLGNGIGLLIVKKIINVHKGTVSIGNKGDGAYVSIRLPIN